MVLFFTKNDGKDIKGTNEIWFYDLKPKRSLGKKNPLNSDDLAEFLAFLPERKDSECSWVVDMDDVDQATWDLTPNNPNAPEQAALREPKVILDEMRALEAKNRELLDSIEALLS